MLWLRCSCVDERMRGPGKHLSCFFYLRGEEKIVFCVLDRSFRAPVLNHSFCVFRVKMEITPFWHLAIPFVFLSNHYLTNYIYYYFFFHKSHSSWFLSIQNINPVVQWVIQTILSDSVSHFRLCESFWSIDLKNWIIWLIHSWILLHWLSLHVEYNQ